MGLKGHSILPGTIAMLILRKYVFSLACLVKLASLMLVLEHRLVEEVIRVFLRLGRRLMLVVMVLVILRMLQVALKAAIDILGEVVHDQALLQQRGQLRVQLHVGIGELGLLLGCRGGQRLHLNLSLDLP